MKVVKIGIVGQQCSGKTTAANFLSEHFDETRFIKFADPIYGTLKALRQEKNRAFMQEFGDFAKKHFGEHIFVVNFNVAVQEYEEYLNNLRENVREYLIVCDDIRRKYEFDAAKELGFKIISIDANTKTRKKRAEKLGLDFIEDHNSETEIPEILYKADYVIVDSGWLSKRKLKKYMKNALDQLTL